MQIPKIDNASTLTHTIPFQDSLASPQPSARPTRLGKQETKPRNSYPSEPATILWVLLRNRCPGICSSKIYPRCIRIVSAAILQDSNLPQLPSQCLPHRPPRTSPQKYQNCPSPHQTQRRQPPRETPRRRRWRILGKTKTSHRAQTPRQKAIVPRGSHKDTDRAWRRPRQRQYHLLCMIKLALALRHQRHIERRQMHPARQRRARRRPTPLRGG